MQCVITQKFELIYFNNCRKSFQYNNINYNNYKLEIKLTKNRFLSRTQYTQLQIKQKKCHNLLKSPEHIGDKSHGNGILGTEWQTNNINHRHLQLRQKPWHKSGALKKRKENSRPKGKKKRKNNLLRIRKENQIKIVEPLSQNYSPQLTQKMKWDVKQNMMTPMVKSNKKKQEQLQRSFQVNVQNYFSFFHTF